MQVNFMPGEYQNNIAALPSLTDYRYENIFKMYQQKNGGYYYNILNKVTIPDNIDKNVYYTIVVNEKIPWTTVSYTAYGTIDLWWLIVILNKIKDPTQVPSGTIKILKPEYVRLVISDILNTL